MHIAEAAVGKGEGQTKLHKSLLRLNLSDYVEEFFVGITHDKNMRRLAEVFEAEQPDLSQGNPDFFQQFGLSHKESIRDSPKVREEELILPIFSNYKMTSLD